MFSFVAALTSTKLVNVARVAIWDKNKIIVVVSTGMWGTNVVFLIQGMSYSLLEFIELQLNVVWHQVSWG